MKGVLGIMAAASIAGSVIGGINPILMNNNHQKNITNLSDVSLQKSSDDYLLKERDGNISTNLSLFLRPGTFEDVIHLHRSLSDDEFQSELYSKAVNGWNYVDPNESTWSMVSAIAGSWSKIYNAYQNTSKINRIKLNFKQVESNFQFETTYLGLDIDSKEYDNVYFNNLNNVFNGQLKMWKQIKGGVANNDSPDSILTQIESAFPKLRSLNKDDKITVASIKPYSYFTQGYSVKLTVSYNSSFLSVGLIPREFILNTKENFAKINSEIENDLDIKEWHKEFKEFQSTIQREIKEDVPTFTEAQKRTWKDQSAEIVKGYLRDRNIIKRLLFDELRINELKTSIDKLEIDIQNIKNEISKIQEKVEDIINGTRNKGCEELKFVSEVGRFIPEVGFIFSSVVKVMSTLCDIQAA